jgi:hypothetical protein
MNLYMNPRIIAYYTVRITDRNVPKLAGISLEIPKVLHVRIEKRQCV